jgi:hypothetical protein
MSKTPSSISLSIVASSFADVSAGASDRVNLARFYYLVDQSYLGCGPSGAAMTSKTRAGQSRAGIALLRLFSEGNE